jgi:DNA-cytosine methyltransferase
MNVLSLFDGMSCTQIALKNLGIKVDTYYASEIDKYAIKVAKENFPETIHLGDIKDIKGKDLPKIDLIVAGSPCQGFSFAGKQLAFDDPRSALFFEFVRLLREVKPKYFLLENVRMKKEHMDVISQQVSDIYPECSNGSLFGIEPILINSALLSAQNRNRLYWTNIPNIEQPEDVGLVLRDVLEYEPKEFTKMSDNFLKRNGERNCMIDDTKEKAHTLSAMEYVKNGRQGNYLACDSEGNPTYNTPKQVGNAKEINGHDILKRVYSEDGKSPTLNSMGGGNREPKVAVKGGAIRARSKDSKGKHVGWKETKPKQVLEIRKDDKSNSLTSVTKDSLAVKEEELTWRKLTPLECERLQTVPDNYTDGVSNTQRYKMLGNGFTVKVIEHILTNMEK